MQVLKNRYASHPEKHLHREICDVENSLHAARRREQKQLPSPFPPPREPFAFQRGLMMANETPGGSGGMMNGGRKRPRESDASERRMGFANRSPRFTPSPRLYDELPGPARIEYFNDDECVSLFPKERWEAGAVPRAMRVPEKPPSRWKLEWCLLRPCLTRNPAAV